MSAYNAGRTLRALQREYADCTRCPHLCESRSQVVFGSGKVTGPIMVIGDKPGPEEDDAGGPFVGEAGRVLMDMLSCAWPKGDDAMRRIRKIGSDDEDSEFLYYQALREYLDQFVFWTNARLCYGPRDVTTTEMRNCLSRLHNTIYAVDPLLIIAAGGDAATALMGKKFSSTHRFGQLRDISIPSPVTGEPVRYTMLGLGSPIKLLERGDLQAARKGVQTPRLDAQDALREALSLLEILHHNYYDTSFPPE